MESTSVWLSPDHPLDDSPRDGWTLFPSIPELLPEAASTPAKTPFLLSWIVWRFQPASLPRAGTGCIPLTRSQWRPLRELASGGTPAEPPLVDIVAVHGLNPRGKDKHEHAYDTWRKPAGAAGRLWLRDDLPSTLPRARIFLYEYNSKMVYGGDKGNFLDTANLLLEALFIDRRHAPLRPLLLLGHSLGGLLIKQALINAHDNRRYENIISSVYALVFFGTPHEGGNDALVKLGATAARIASSLGFQPQESIVEALKKGSLFAETLKESFRHQLEDYEIVSFWEGKGNIVSKESATLGLAGLRENIVQLDANHGDLCRYGPEQRDQDNFKFVSENISMLYAKAVAGGPTVDVYSLLVCSKEIASYVRTERASAHSHTMEEDLEEDLEWFQNTSLHHAWLSPARGPVVCSRLLRMLEPLDFGLKLLRNASKSGTDLLYFDCGRDFSQSLSSALTRAVGETSKTAVVLWWLIVQAVCRRWDSIDAIEQLLLQHRNDDVSKEMPCGVLGRILCSALNRQPGLDANIVIDNVDQLGIDELSKLRNAIQDVLDSQRFDHVAQTRCLIVGQETFQVKYAFKGTAVVTRNIEYLECLHSLRLQATDLRRSKVATAYVGTNHWIWSSSALVDWTRKSSSILWIEGNPGTGKSVLARSIEQKYAKEAALNQGSLIIATWFYSSRDGQTSHYQMLMALVYQLLAADQHLFEQTRTLYRQKRWFDISIEERWTMEDLENMLRQILQYRTVQRPILFVLDGLDEAKRDLLSRDRSTSEILDFFTGLLPVSEDVKMIVLSRPASDIEKGLRKWGHIVMHVANRADIEKLVEDGLNSLSSLMRLSGSSGEISSASGDDDLENEAISSYFQQAKRENKKGLNDIRDRLLTDANGVILWVNTVLKALVARCEGEAFSGWSEVKVALSRLPGGLDHLYKVIIDDLLSSALRTKPKQEIARRALMWVTVAPVDGSFQLQQLLQTMVSKKRADDATEQTLYMPMVHSWNSFRQELRKLCGPFIEVIKSPSSVTYRATDQVQLLHQTVKTFLEDEALVGPLRFSIEEAATFVRLQSEEYLSMVLPETPANGDPLRNDSKTFETDLEGWVSKIALHLENKPLLPYIFKSIPRSELQVPHRWTSLLVNTLAAPRPIPSSDLMVEKFFFIMSIKGFATATRTILDLHSMIYGLERTNWYLLEVPILHGTLLAAIRCRLVPEIKTLAWYIAQRGVNILDIPEEVREDDLRINKIIKAVIETLDEEVALIVIGYKDQAERSRLLSMVRSFQQQHHQPVGLEQHRTAVERVRRAVAVVIDFWINLPTMAGMLPGTRMYINDSGIMLASSEGDVNAIHRSGPTESTLTRGNEDDASNADTRVSTSHEPGGKDTLGGTTKVSTSSERGVDNAQEDNTNAPTSSEGADYSYQAPLGNFGFGANVIGPNILGYDKTNERVLRESHQLLTEEIAILRGARNAYNPNIPSNMTAIYSSDWMELPGELETQTSEEEFAQKMNDAAWSTKSSAASDKVQ